MLYVPSGWQVEEGGPEYPVSQVALHRLPGGLGPVQLKLPLPGCGGLSVHTAGTNSIAHVYK